MKPGDRVGAILSIKDGVAKLLGFGVYEGREVPDASAGAWAEFYREHKTTNPKIKLDDGQVVWGCECWWGSEDQIKLKLLCLRVEPTSIADVRAARTTT